MRYLPAVIFSLLFACAGDSPEPEQAAAGYLMFVGTYTRETSKGIRAYRFDPASGRATDLGLAAELREPSFLAPHPNRKYLYALSEIDDYDSNQSGSISSFSIDASSGKPDRTQRSFLARRMALPPQRGRRRQDAHRRQLQRRQRRLVSHRQRRRPGAKPCRFFQHEGGSVHPRQEQAHAHSADFSPDNRFAFFSDLGLDQVKVYAVDPQNASMQPHDPPHVGTAPGAGPRHFAFHPSGQFATASTNSIPR